MQSIPPLEMIANRVIWSFVTVCILLFIRKDWGKLIGTSKKPGVFLSYTAASLLIGINWLIYIWAVNSKFIIETSLGYFINPLLSVFLGVLFLKERLRKWQWIPLILVASRVIYMTLAYGQIPWIALSLALTFGLYGLVKKTTPLGSLFGLTLETGVLFFPAFAYLLILQFSQLA
jgi:chloramphenicol-sensitive protein RarD